MCTLHYNINETVKLKVPFTNTLMNLLLEVTPEVNTINKFKCKLLRIFCMTDFFKSRHQYNCKTKQILHVNFFSEVTHKKALQRNFIGNQCALYITTSTKQ